ncbi:hypothetical protein [Croceicoccus mobilis]|uniref:Uncharacterized protein n=1 Tax=Croceicoccus mobilis TaxID=1703339 RepID=A0A916YRX4_9SPHN|nr:hypothetical protein [Croceicoccus mobilis]GGD57116.1 hypothetical protein GCM10010990_02930 [Croceicoccus mobilis]
MPKGFRQTMHQPKSDLRAASILKAISLAEAALEACDQNGLSAAAIDLSGAIEKMKAILAS